MMKYPLASLLLLATTSFQQHHATSAFSIEPLLHFSTGAIAGGIGAVVAYPCDYIKSQLQTEHGKDKYKGNGWDCFVETIQENPLKLYRGVTVQVIGIAPEKGIKLGVNDVLSSYSYSNLGGFPLEIQILSGAVSGFCQVIASSPLEVLKVGLQTSNQSFEDVWISVGGYKGLFRGASACICRDVIFTAICFPLYKELLDLGLNPFVAGAISGVISSFAATPPDVIKTRILAQDDHTMKQKQQQRQMMKVSPFPRTAALATAGAVAVQDKQYFLGT